MKLNWFLINFKWTVRFPKIIQKCLPRVGSDHVPIRLEVGSHCFSPRPFRYKLVWSIVEGFQELITQWWNSSSPARCGAFVMAKKVAALREQLRRWTKFSFGYIKLKKIDLLQEIEKIDVLKESRSLYPTEVEQELVLREKLGEIHKQEEIYWKQKSRL